MSSNDRENGIDGIEMVFLPAGLLVLSKTEQVKTLVSVALRGIGVGKESVIIESREPQPERDYSARHRPIANLRIIIECRGNRVDITRLINGGSQQADDDSPVQYPAVIEVVSRLERAQEEIWFNIVWEEIVKYFHFPGFEIERNADDYDYFCGTRMNTEPREFTFQRFREVFEQEGVANNSSYFQNMNEIRTYVNNHPEGGMICIYLEDGSLVVRIASYGDYGVIQYGHPGEMSADKVQQEVSSSRNRIFPSNPDDSNKAGKDFYSALADDGGQWPSFYDGEGRKTDYDLSRNGEDDENVPDCEEMERDIVNKLAEFMPEDKVKVYRSADVGNTLRGLCLDGRQKYITLPVTDIDSFCRHFFSKAEQLLSQLNSNQVIVIIVSGSDVYINTIGKQEYESAEWEDIITEGVDSGDATADKPELLQKKLADRLEEELLTAAIRTGEQFDLLMRDNDDIFIIQNGQPVHNFCEEVIAVFKEMSGSLETDERIVVVVRGNRVCLSIINNSDLEELDEMDDLYEFGEDELSEQPQVFSDDYGDISKQHKDNRTDSPPENVFLTGGSKPPAEAKTWYQKREEICRQAVANLGRKIVDIYRGNEDLEALTKSILSGLGIDSNFIIQVDTVAGRFGATDTRVTIISCGSGQSYELKIDYKDHAYLYPGDVAFQLYNQIAYFFA